MPGGRRRAPAEAVTHELDVRFVNAALVRARQAVPSAKKPGAFVKFTG
jgi:hypothetical protein